MSKKRGQLSLEEEKFIKDNISSSSIAEIAINLNRTEAPIKRFIEENGLFESPENKIAHESLRLKLRGKNFYQEIKAQFEESELQSFEETWIGLILQFKEDVMPSEELQIKQYITLDVLLNRSMKERKRHVENVEKLQSLVDKEYLKPEDSRDAPKLMNLETQLAYARSSMANYTNEYTKLLAEHQKIGKDLKATREQRIKRIEDGKSSWTGLIRMLEESDIREKQGREMEILKLASDKAQSSLMDYHQYADGTVDRPFLTPESVLLEEEKT